MSHVVEFSTVTSWRCSVSSGFGFWNRLLPPMGDDGLPGDLQSLSWLTAVDVPRLQQMASGRIDLGGPGAPHPHPGRLKQDRWPWLPARGVLEAPVALTSLFISVKWEQVHTSLVICQAEEDTWTSQALHTASKLGVDQAQAKACPGRC